MDPLSAILLDIRLSCGFHIRADLSAPWGIAIPPESTPSYQYVQEGRVRVECLDRQPFWLEAGDLAFFPRGCERVLRDAEGSALVPFRSLLYRDGQPVHRFTAGGGGPTSVVLGGTLVLQSGGALHPLLTALPDIVRVPSTDAHDAHWVGEQLARQQLDGAKPGSRAVQARLSEVLFLQAVRAAVASDGEQTGLVAALADRQIAASVLAMRMGLDKPWTLAMLARIAAMSRTAYADRFRALTGQTPMRTLKELRLARAGALLLEGRGVEQVAAEVGYASRSSFSAAFRATYGVTPSRFRRMTPPRTFE